MEHAMDWDVLVVGRSYAGLSAALTLGRARVATLVVGEGEPRNGAVAHAHGLLTRDGAAPQELVAIADQEVGAYPSVERVEGRVTSIEQIDGGFRAHFTAGAATMRGVILATGVNDDPPGVAGLAEHWGRGVFTCPFCDGWEHRDQPLVTFGDPVRAAHLGRLLRGWSDDVTVVGPELDDDAASALATAGAKVERAALVRVVGDGRSVERVELADGRSIPAGAVFVAAGLSPNASLAVELGCDLDGIGGVAIDAMRATSVPWVWAVGDLAHPMLAQMAVGLADGVVAAAACVNRLREP